uniref:Peptidylglycine alpha-amidating monooxygenase n=1 Tax=Terrapene triunguis TaxID=2587831 RepID=A0A674K3W9_9SAUR
ELIFSSKLFLLVLHINLKPFFNFLPLRYKDTTRSLSSECLGNNRPVISLGLTDFALDIRMPGVTPKQSDTYLCMSLRLPVDEEAYVVDFRPQASMDTVHHMLLFGCNVPSSTENYWDCDEGICTDKSNILYAWARNAPPTRLPKGVGFKVGGETGSKYFVLQVHYGDVSAFRECSLILIYHFPWILFQAFYPVEHPVDISFGDTLAARCVFTGEGRTTETHIGGTASDEMCNFYIMYYMEAKHAVSYMTCTQNINPDMFRNIPQEANIPIPVKSDMIMMTHGHHHEDDSSSLKQPKREEEEVLDQGDFYSLISKLLGEREDVVHVHKYNPTEKAESDLVAEIANVVQKKDLGWFDAREVTNHDERANTSLARNRIHKFHRLESTLRPPENRHFSLQRDEGSWEKEHTGDFHIEEAVDWPGVNLKLGQVSGLALDPKNNLVIFHRGDHVWDRNSFDSSFVYQQRGLGPIEQNTILVIDPSNAEVLDSTGKNLFYLPHGLSIDKDGNYWVTDVALHQVFKLGVHDKEPLLILGRSLQPGSDKNHFCQPTDVAVDPVTGNIYVSDGYCNSRIVVFSPNGMFIMQWGEETSVGKAKPGQFRIPHSLTLVPEFGQLCVADRGNGRIQCFRSETGEFTREIKHKLFGRELFAVSYIPGGLLFAVNGVPYPGDIEPVQGFMMNFSTGEIMDTFIPVRKSFEMPHDVVASEDKTVYVGDVHAKTVWKFTSTESMLLFWPEEQFCVTEMEHRSVKKAGIEVQEIKEAETVIEAKLKNKPVSTESPKKWEKHHMVEQASPGISFVLITTLLIIPIVVLLAIAVFIRWRKTRVYGADADHKLESSSGRILGRLQGKGSGGLNLGNFFASHKSYSRKGFDRLSTEGSDQEKDEDDGTDSEEEYSAPPPPPVSSSS